MFEENDEVAGEQVEVHSGMWASHLDEHVRRARDTDMESHTRIVDTDNREHSLELGEDVEKVEAEEGGHTLIWIRNVGIVTVTGGAIAAAIAIIRHRRKSRG